ncbi:RagB/SusD family nutrient uptake outer membrane protein [Geofilum rubicundum]|nr:RagB/SusD family nutrient uptake outer membrane protein [Geofilum rubicundum]
MDLERENYPPTLYGNGRVNPTQNLVDAFPMANGYPLSHASSGYDPANPYAGRDPRLAMYIVFNGSTAGPQSTVINTAADASDNNGLNRTETSTRTGYYMRKLLNQSVNANPNSETPGNRYKAFIRYTEIFLGYAEAANEAWGPTGTGTHGFSAYDVVKGIRQRAGIDAADPYLESIKGDQDQMRELIRNERRLELSFEGFRFWDLRRWKEDLTEVARGMRITGGVHNVIDVEERAYRDYMYYGPIPYGEVNKFSELIQNKGW